MRRLRLWTVVAVLVAGFLDSCGLNPQPEPPSSTPRDERDAASGAQGAVSGAPGYGGAANGSGGTSAAAGGGIALGLDGSVVLMSPDGSAGGDTNAAGAAGAAGQAGMAGSAGAAGVGP
jgi:hypothetical protein